MVSIQEMVAAISIRTDGRYEIAPTDTVETAATTSEIDTHAMQLKRACKENAGWRTLLIASLPFETAKIQAAFRWAADVRDMLPEPETADLYMFLLIEGVTSEDAARIESDDRFCRKLVLKAQDEVDTFLDRCFLATLSPADSSDGISDPLLASLESLELKHSWVEPHIKTWKELLLSGQPSGDIADALKETAFGNEERQ